MRKGAPNLYEILKTSQEQKSVPASAEPEKAAPAVSAAVAPEPAPVVVAAPVVTADAPVIPEVHTRPEVPHVVLKAQPPTLPKPTAPREVSGESESAGGEGERTLTVTYNTALFSGLITLGLLFIAYSLGVQRGKSTSTETAAATLPEPQRSPESTAPAAAVPATKTFWTLRLTEWPMNRVGQQVPAETVAQKYKEALAAKLLKEVWFETVQRNGGKVLVMYYGQYLQPGTAPSRDALEKLRRVTIRDGRNNLTPFVRAEEIVLTR